MLKYFTFILLFINCAGTKMSIKGNSYFRDDILKSQGGYGQKNEFYTIYGCKEIKSKSTFNNIFKEFGNFLFHYFPISTIIIVINYNNDYDNNFPRGISEPIFGDRIYRKDIYLSRLDSNECQIKIKSLEGNK